MSQPIIAGSVVAVIILSGGLHPAGRLASVEDTVAGECTTRIYAYDDDSNRTSITTRDPEPDGTCATSGGTTISSAYDEADRATKAGYSFDAFGRITEVPAADAGQDLALTYHENDRVRRLAAGASTTTVSRVSSTSSASCAAFATGTSPGQSG